MTWVRIGLITLALTLFIIAASTVRLFFILAMIMVSPRSDLMPLTVAARATGRAVCGAVWVHPGLRIKHSTLERWNDD